MSMPYRPPTLPVYPSLPYCSNGNLLPTEIPLDDYGAPGFKIRERLDFSGHLRNRERDPALPHENTEVINEANGRVVADYLRDLSNSQLSGFNAYFKDRNEEKP
jgi:hypothetical protein